MRFLKSIALASAALLTLSGVVASASEYNKKTELTVKETIEVPGAILPPGKYVVKLVDSDSNRHIVQFLNERENKVLSTVIAIPNSRMEPTGKTQFEWYETPAGQPPALRAWFYPGDNFGQEFAYPKDRATTLAQTSRQEVPQMTEQESVSMAAKPEPQPRAEEQTAQAAPAPLREERPTVTTRERETVIAQAAPAPQPQPRPQAQAQPEPQPMPSQPAMPQTAGFGALLALIGFSSLGAAAAVRKLRR